MRRRKNEFSAYGEIKFFPWVFLILLFRILRLNYYPLSSDHFI